MQAIQPSFGAVGWMLTHGIRRQGCLKHFSLDCELTWGGMGRIDNESSAHPESALLLLTRMSCLKKLCGRQQQCVNQDYPVEFSRHYGKVYTVEHVRRRVGEHTFLSFYFPFSILFPSWDDALCIAIQVSEVSVFLWQLRQGHLLVA